MNEEKPKQMCEFYTDGNIGKAEPRQMCEFYTDDNIVETEGITKKEECLPEVEQRTPKVADERLKMWRNFSSCAKSYNWIGEPIKTFPETEEVLKKVEIYTPPKDMIKLLPGYNETPSEKNSEEKTNSPPNQITNYIPIGSVYDANVVPYIPYSIGNMDISQFYQNHPQNFIERTEMYLNTTDTEFIHDVGAKRFMRWNGCFWERVSTEYVKADIMRVMKAFYNVTKDTEFNNEAKTCGNFSVINEILEGIRNLRKIEPNEFNTIEHCLCLKNGVFSFDTGTLLPHSYYKNNYITYMIDVEYIPNYYDYTFSNFIKSIMLDDENAACLQRIYGYPLLGDPKEEICFILNGDGANGKSTLNIAVQNLVGELATVMKIECFTSTANINPDSPSPSTYQLKDKLYAFTSEGKAGASLNDNAFKRHIGSGKLTGRNPHKDSVEFDSKFVLFFDTNHLPHFSEGGYSMECRIVIIPFPATFKGDSLNKDMGRQLNEKGCRKALLAWLIDGAMAYKQYGFKFTKRILDATEQYFLAEDTVGMFLKDEVIDDPYGKVTMKDLYNSYCSYCDQRLLTPKSKDAFSKHEGLRKYESRRNGKIGRYKTGLRLKGTNDNET